jgi:hypothetical protein
MSITLLGLYGVFDYGTLLGAHICAALGVAVLYVSTRRPLSRHTSSTGEVDSGKRIGDNVCIWREHDSLRAEMSALGNPGNILLSESTARIEVDGRALKISTDWENINRTYDVRLVTHLRIIEALGFQSVALATIAFDYEGRPEALATNLTSRDSEILLEEITRFLKVVGSPAKV